MGGGALALHSDFAFMEHPVLAISLHAMAVPTAGGETVFVDLAHAYRRLPEPLKQRIATLEARHVINYGGDRPTFDPDAPAP